MPVSTCINCTIFLINFSFFSLLIPRTLWITDTFRDQKERERSGITWRIDLSIEMDKITFLWKTGSILYSPCSHKKCNLICKYYQRDFYSKINTSKIYYYSISLELENLKLLDPSHPSTRNFLFRIYRELRLIKVNIALLEKKSCPGTRFPSTFRGSSSSIAFELLFPVRLGGTMHFLDRGAPRTKVTTLHNNQE